METLPSEIILHIVSFKPKIVREMSAVNKKFYLICTSPYADEHWEYFASSYSIIKNAENLLHYVKLTKPNINYYYKINEMLDAIRIRRLRKCMFYLPTFDINLIADKLYAIPNRYNNFINLYNELTANLPELQKSIYLALMVYVLDALYGDKKNLIMKELANMSPYNSLPPELINAEDIYKAFDLLNSINPFVFKYTISDCQNVCK